MISSIPRRSARLAAKAAASTAARNTLGAQRVTRAVQAALPPAYTPVAAAAAAVIFPPWPAEATFETCREHLIKLMQMSHSPGDPIHYHYNLQLFTEILNYVSSHPIFLAPAFSRFQYTVLLKCTELELAARDRPSVYRSALYAAIAKARAIFESRTAAAATAAAA